MVKMVKMGGAQTTFRRLFFFFFSKTKSFASKTFEKRKSPVSYVFSLARFFPPTFFFSFFGGGGGQPGAVSAIFCFVFFLQKNEGETFLVPAEKKKARRNKRAKTKNQSSSRAVREKSQRSHSLKSLFCRFRDDDNDLLDIFFLPFSIDEEVVREEHHRRRRFEEERR